MLIGTVLRILTLPLMLLTLGLFSIFVNALLLQIVDGIMDDFTIDEFGGPRSGRRSSSRSSR